MCLFLQFCMDVVKLFKHICYTQLDPLYSMLEKDELINHRYEIQEIIGNGTFGNIYRARCKKKDLFYAVKTENVHSPYITLTHECNVLKYLYDNRCRSIPHISWYGLHKNMICLITPLYDMTLTAYLQKNKLSMSSLCKLFPKLITLMQTIHELHVIHRDIKPDNFMVKNGELFLIDFGLAHVCIDQDSQHIENTQQTEITGNIRFCSYYVMIGHRPSVRDDIISLGYMFLYIINLELPWDSVPRLEDSQYARNHILHIRNKKIAQLKNLDSIKKFSSSINKDLIMYFQYIYSISYDEMPCYDAVRKLFT